MRADEDAAMAQRPRRLWYTVQCLRVGVFEEARQSPGRLAGQMWSHKETGIRVQGAEQVTATGKGWCIAASE